MIARDDEEADLLAMLSPREQQILERAARGLTNAEVAVELSVSTHAVKFHLAHIYRKLGAANRTDAATRYVKAMR
ncbi:MAG: helix-turn-helix transcriptional regulator [Gaiellaceae bacterium MAG52_C11]|nr:helix-turn-helix transcriptional regulator [Candidatus Gaiellasilicea maunaloa]